MAAKLKLIQLSGSVTTVFDWGFIKKNGKFNNGKLLRTDYYSFYYSMNGDIDKSCLCNIEMRVQLMFQLPKKKQIQGNDFWGAGEV